MGPHFFKCGKIRRLLYQGQAKEGFNGAALFQVRKVHCWVSLLAKILSGFNGAALFQVRKGANIADFRLILPLLQWGRTFSSAESLDDWPD